jgi:FtsZ-interacting cell division protein YlmF
VAKKALEVKSSAPARQAAPFPGISITLDLHPTAHANGLKAVQDSQGISITDKASHESARSLAKGWKAEKRDVETWYRDRMVTPLKKALDWARDQMNTDLSLFDTAITGEDRLDTAYVRDQQRIEQEAANERRRQAEADEQARREKEAAEAEAAALKLEESTVVLSPREERFVFEWVKKAQGPNDAVRIAKLCGYANPQQAAERLIASEKVQVAIANLLNAQAIRRESEAKQAAPVVVDVQPVESQIGKVSGTSLRTYYGVGAVDLKALIGAVLDGRVSMDAIQPNLAFLGEQARSLKENFPKVYVGCELTKRDGVTG